MFQFAVRRRSQAFSPGDTVDLYINKQNGPNSALDQPYLDSKILLYTTDSLFTHHNTEILTQLASSGVEHSNHVLVASQDSNTNTMTLCERYEVTSVKLNRVDVIRPSQTSEPSIVGKRQEISQQNPQRQSIPSHLQSSAHRSGLLISGLQQQTSVISESSQYSQHVISHHSLTTSRPTTRSTSVSSDQVTLQSFNWLDGGSHESLVGFFPERWFADNELSSARSKRDSDPNPLCTSKVYVQSSQLASTAR